VWLTAILKGLFGMTFIRSGYQQNKCKLLIAAAIFTALTAPSLILLK
jgi:hypothetical protein